MAKLHKNGVECIITKEIIYKSEADAKKQLKQFNSLVKNPSCGLTIKFIKDE